MSDAVQQDGTGCYVQQPAHTPGHTRMFQSQSLWRLFVYLCSVLSALCSYLNIREGLCVLMKTVGQAHVGKQLL